MTEQHKQKLQKNFKKLVDDLEVNTVLDSLHQEDIITGESYEQICAERVRAKQARLLLNLLPTRGDNAYYAFLRALGKSQPWLRQMIVDTVFTELD